MGIISETIRYEGDNSTFIWKYPNEDFNNLTKLIVHESQEAIFFLNGQALDTFGPGRYTLDTNNIPLLSRALNVVTGVNLLHAEVYFINKTVQMAIKWGTDSKVRFVEPTLGVPVELGACGEMNLRVSDGKKLLLNLVGTTKGIAWGEGGDKFTKSLQSSFKPLISQSVKTNLPATIKQENIDIVEIDEHLDVISRNLHNKINPGFEEYGLTIPQFYLTTIVLPETDPNFRRLRELHTINIQKKMAMAEAEVKKTQAEARAISSTAEAEASAQIKAAQRAAILEEQTTETEVARRAAERKIIEAQADAQAAALAGMAEAEVMKAKGYTQKDVLQAEVQKSFAEGIGNMGPAISAGGGGGNSMVGDIVGLGISMQAAKMMTSQMGDMFSGMAGTTASAQTPVTSTSETANDTIACPTCGNKLPSNAKFCLECGTKIEQLAPNECICPSCGKKTPKGKFCMECGAPMVKKCVNCGAEIPEGGKFCLECGTKV